MLKWLNVEAEESISRFEVLSSDIHGILEQRLACDELHCVAKVLLSVCFNVRFITACSWQMFVAEQLPLLARFH